MIAATRRPSIQRGLFIRETLPVGATGKILKRELIDDLQAGIR
jgi:hypothetical protein